MKYMINYVLEHPIEIIKVCMMNSINLALSAYLSLNGCLIASIPKLLVYENTSGDFLIPTMDS